MVVNSSKSIFTTLFVGVRRYLRLADDGETCTISVRCIVSEVRSAAAAAGLGGGGNGNVNGGGDADGGIVVGRVLMLL
jgi:hypothetical protein